MDDDLPLPVRFVAYPLMLAAVVWVNWCVVIAFIGGTMPIIGWEVDGGFGFGLLFLFVGEPIFLTLAYWVFMLAVVPLMLLFRPWRRERDE